MADLRQRGYKEVDAFNFQRVYVQFAPGRLSLIGIISALRLQSQGDISAASFCAASP